MLQRLTSLALGLTLSFAHLFTAFAGDIKVILPTVTKALYSTKPKSFAIVVDKKTYENATEAIDLYCTKLHKLNLADYRIIADDATPDEIRKVLHDIEPAIVGAFLIGDIPIAMISNAQHLTTAFKMDETKFDLHRSSVPSDRFYDDAGLRFRPIKREGNFFYYRLDEDGAQRLNPAFFVSRLTVPKAMKADAYTLIDKYLRKASKLDTPIDTKFELVTYAGHGYNSDCLMAWADERKLYDEMFGGNGQEIRSLNYRSSNDMKSVILDELAHGNADVMIFNEHGSSDKQYLTTNLAINDRKTALDLFQSSLFETLRKAKTPQVLDSLKTDLAKRYHLTPEFFNEALSPQRISADSLREANYDLTLGDMGKDFRPTPKFVVLDACYNGDFSDDDYVAAHYIFSDGSTLAVQANSRNVLQDRRTNEDFGLLSSRYPVGILNRLVPTLEGHLFGDPTLYFPRPGTKKFAPPHFTLPKTRSERRAWMKHSSPNFRAAGLRLAAQSGEAKPEMLLAGLRDTSVLVRLAAFKALSQLDDPNIREQAFRMAITDKHELVARQAALEVKKWGIPATLPVIAEAYVGDVHRLRVRFNLSSALYAFSPKNATEALIKAAEKLRPGDEGLKKRITAKSEELVRFRNNIVEPLKDPSTPLKAKLQAARTVRNYQIHDDIETLMEIISDPKTDSTLTLTLIEALGWFDRSHRKSQLVEFCEQCLSQPHYSEEIKAELRQTINRLSSTTSHQTRRYE
ncbi:HEAT repeat domain-containing protein [Porphyromonas sp.]|uniref:HEAT repeat domain-containing protein n=1 Tax=Porphyromonas sp. TaxID=1924944 RepID=UPI0026DD690A|nr:HEAT repeat domain-containing protein [Porphyromonas sp.]MDO4771178.1 HEAT repeat domain-containing protein [Porphyromonas sp.]